MEGVIPEDMVHECTKRRQELIGINFCAPNPKFFLFIFKKNTKFGED